MQQFLWAPGNIASIYEAGLNKIKAPGRNLPGAFLSELRIHLFQEHHLPGFGGVIVFNPVEVNAGSDIGCIPANEILAGLKVT